MDAIQARTVIEALMGGADPRTGELLPPNDVLNCPLVRNALLFATRALEKERHREERARRLPGQAGHPWSAEEDARLSEAFLRGTLLKELTDTHQRTPGAIRSRLVRLGLLVTDDGVLPSIAVPEPQEVTESEELSEPDRTEQRPESPEALVNKRGYALGVSGTHVFSLEEREVLHRYGFWLEALADGRIEPITPAQAHFCSVVRGEAKSQTLHERAWMRLVGRREIEPDLKREYEVSDPGEEWFKREAHWRYQ